MALLESGAPILLTVAISLAKDMRVFPFFSILFFEKQSFRGVVNFSPQCHHLAMSIKLLYAEGVIPDLGDGL